MKKFFSTIVLLLAIVVGQGYAFVGFAPPGAEINSFEQTLNLQYSDVNQDNTVVASVAINTGKEFGHQIEYSNKFFKDSDADGWTFNIYDELDALQEFNHFDVKVYLAVNFELFNDDRLDHQTQWKNYPEAVLFRNVGKVAPFGYINNQLKNRFSHTNRFSYTFG